MYSIQPILKQVQVDLPTCMYQMKNIIASESEKKSLTSTAVRDDIPLLEALELRQKNILQQLNELRQQLTSMRIDLGGCNKPAQPVSVQQSTKSSNQGVKPINTQYLDDLVINVSPNNVPYSLLAIKCLWRNRLNIQFECFTHSTVSTLTDEAKNFQTALQKTARTALNIPSIKISLIWKDVGVNTELIASQTTYVHGVIGEVNIVRYLSRVGPEEFSYESSAAAANETDIIFDICHQLIKLKTIKDRQNLVRLLSTRLGKSKYFGNNASAGLADIAVCSTIKQLPVVLTKDLTPSMSNWLKVVSEHFGY